MEDRKIIELYHARDEQAIAATESKYGSYCTAIARRILENPSDTEECLNDTWLGAWNSMPPHWPQVLSAFLGRITRNLAFRRRQSLQAAKRGGGAFELCLEELAECVADTRTVEDTVAEKALAESIDRFLRARPKRERALFLRRYFYAEPVAEIAAATGLKANHVSVILRRTRQKLRMHLEEEGYRI